MEREGGTRPEGFALLGLIAFSFALALFGAAFVAGAKIDSSVHQDPAVKDSRDFDDLETHVIL